LFTKILSAIEATKGEVKMASATFHLVEAPDLNINIKNKNGFISSILNRTFSWICYINFRLLKLPNAIGLMLVSVNIFFFFNHGLFSFFQRRYCPQNGQY
jgi:hypothetical protein